jgi:WD40 repeat protein
MTLAVGDVDGNVRVFQIAAKGMLSRPLYELAGRPRESQSLDNPPVVAVSWDGALLYSLYGHDSVNVWDLHNPQSKAVTNTFSNMGEDIKEVLVNANIVEMQIAVLTSEGNVRIFSGGYQNNIDLAYVNSTINAIAYSNDGQYIFGASDNNGINIWSIEAPTSVSSVYSPRGIMRSIDYVENSSGKFVIAGGENGAIQIWKVE